MQFQTFCIQHNEIAELNKFLRSHKILSVSKAFNEKDNSWNFCVEYLPEEFEEYRGKAKTNKVDYMQELSVEDFAKFRVLRDCRRIISKENNVPAYTIFLDSDIVLMLKQEITVQTLAAIKGFGEQKMAKYGERFISLWNEYKGLIPKYIEDGQKAKAKENEASGQSV